MASERVCPVLDAAVERKPHRQNPFAERLLGTVRRDCLNHVIVLGEAHLRRTLTRYFRYYHNFRTHLSLEKDAPAPRAIQNANLGPVIEVSEVGGLHHHYERRAVMGDNYIDRRVGRWRGPGFE
jgi:hypothetical protein